MRRRKTFRPPFRLAVADLHEPPAFRAAEEGARTGVERSPVADGGEGAPVASGVEVGQPPVAAELHLGAGVRPRMAHDAPENLPQRMLLQGKEE